MSSKKGLAIAEAFKRYVASTNHFEQCLKQVNIVSSGEGKMKVEFKVSPEHLNERGFLHGGLIATLVDCISTRALSTHEKAIHRGVSVDLSVSYLSAAKEGDNIEVEACTIKTGRTLAFLEVYIRNKDNNRLLATGKHTKFLAVQDGSNVK